MLTSIRRFTYAVDVCLYIYIYIYMYTRVHIALGQSYTVKFLHYYLKSFQILVKQWETIYKYIIFIILKFEYFFLRNVSTLVWRVDKNAAAHQVFVENILFYASLIIRRGKLFNGKESSVSYFTFCSLWHIYFQNQMHTPGYLLTGPSSIGKGKTYE